MTTIPNDFRDELAQAKQWMLDHPAITGVYLGFKMSKGVKTKERCLVFTVAKKSPLAEIPVSERIPLTFDGARTDVVEASFSALGLTTRQRPCPAGFSIGHVKVTAGTFGLPVKRGASNEWLALTNNHVAANSNNALIGDRILQPGKADGGVDTADWWGALHEFVTIKFDGQAPPPKKRRGVARAWWAGVRAVGNAGAKLTNCPFRVHVGPMTVDQPSPNLVDAALVKPAAQSALSPVVHGFGPVNGIRDLKLGDKVLKVGRTTERTAGIVDGVSAQVKVNYGDAGTATFNDQIIIRSTGTGEFSAGGDSGSAILTEDGYAGGLLFAGGGGQTIANKMSHVVALLGVRV